MYLYLVYEPFFRYKNYDRFYVALIESTVTVRERYIEKDTYKLEFFEGMQAYAERVLQYLQDKFLRSSFPINIRSGELQAACKEFIAKCKAIYEEKQRLSALPPVPTPLFSAQTATQRVLALIRHRASEELTVVNNSEPVGTTEFLQQLYTCAVIQVCQQALMPAEQGTMLVGCFHEEFLHCRSGSSELNLMWYRASEQEVLRWLQQRSSQLALPQITHTPAAAITSFSGGVEISELFGGDQLFDAEMDELTISNYSPSPPRRSKRKM